MKKSKARKLLSLIIALTMCMSILAGCGNEKQQESSTPSSKQESKSQAESATSSTEEEKELEPVTLKWYLDAKEMEGSSDVGKAFNAKLAELLPNTTVEFTYVEGYKDNWPMFISGGEKMDIAWAGWSTPFLQDVIDGNLLPLNDLIEEYGPNLQEEWDTWTNSYDSAVYEGEIYGIPGVQPTVQESQFFTLADTLYKYIDNDALVKELRATKKMTAKIVEIVEEGAKAAVADGAFKDGQWNVMSGLNYAVRGYMPLGAAKYNMWYDPEVENPVPLFFWEIPEAKMLLDIWARYEDEGMYTETQKLSQMPAGSLSGALGFTTSYTGNWANADERGYEYVPQKDKEGYYKVMSNKPLEAHVGSVNFGSASTYLVIPFTAENPERAIMLIDLLRSEEGTDLMNMLCYGFAKDSEEAKEYGWFNYAVGESDDGQPLVDTSARGDAASKHSLYNWALGNTFKMTHDGGSLTTMASKNYAMGYFTDVYPNLEETPLDGMIVDYSGLNEEFANINAIKAEYEQQLNYGAGGSAKADALYEDVMKKLNEAGLDAVRAELQSQIDAYLAK